jgi:hypothetical protein
MRLYAPICRGGSRRAVAKGACSSTAGVVVDVMEEVVGCWLWSARAPSPHFRGPRVHRSLVCYLRWRVPSSRLRTPTSTPSRRRAQRARVPAAPEQGRPAQTKGRDGQRPAKAIIVHQWSNPKLTFTFVPPSFLFPAPAFCPLAGSEDAVQQPPPHLPTPTRTRGGRACEMQNADDGGCASSSRCVPADHLWCP